MKKIIFLLSFFLVACSPAAGVSGVTPAQVMAIATQPQPIQPTGTPTLVPTATLDHAATLAAANVDTENMRQAAYQAQQEALNYQNTSIAAGVIIVQITAQYEQQQVVIMQATQEADRLTAQSNMWTVTAQPTADAVKRTQQAIDMAKVTLESSRLTATAEAPALIAAINTAEDVAKFGWINYFANVLYAIAAITLPVVGLFIWAYKQNPPVESVPDENIPFHVDRTDGQYKMTRAELNVHFDVLFEFADGYINKGLTPAYDVWDGVISRPQLKVIREYMTEYREETGSHLAREIRGSGGQVDILPAGEDWLRHCLTYGKPPSPTVCIG